MRTLMTAQGRIGHHIMTHWDRAERKREIGRTSFTGWLFFDAFLCVFALI